MKLSIRAKFKSINWLWSAPRIRRSSSALTLLNHAALHFSFDLCRLLKTGFCVLIFCNTSVAHSCADDIADPQVAYVDQYTLRGNSNYLSGYDPLNDDGTVNVVVEIPSGTTAKWEVEKHTGNIIWEFRGDAPRIVRYLAYPGNYGMLPRTLLAKTDGGDGDPLDVIVLGSTIERGAIVRANVIGVLKLLDGGEQDDKLIAVLDVGPLSGARSMIELDEKFPGVSRIIETWFVNYKGSGVVESLGYADRNVGLGMVKIAAQAFIDAER